MYLAGVINQDGVLDGRWPRVPPHRRERTHLRVRSAPRAGVVEMKITQNDVRAIQLAKAALYAGIALLMDRLGIESSIASGLPAPSAATST